MHRIPERRLPALVLCVGLLGGMSGCAPRGTHAAADVRTERPLGSGVAPPVGLVRRESEGERRTRRPRTGPQRQGLASPLILKVDSANGGSSRLFMGYEDIPPGEMIQRHFHPHADEIVFVHRGRGLATLGDREAEVEAGATIYIPHGTRVSLRNTGTDPVTIAFIFADPTMSNWFRDGTVAEGQPAPPMSVADIEARRARHRAHIRFDP